MCGEQPGGKSKHEPKLGSPPRVRGTVSRAESSAAILRITPACAGNSMSENMEADRAQDHPRVCGEQIEVFNIVLNRKGSPPRVRGTDGHVN